MTLLQREMRWRAIAKADRPAAMRVAILATFTAEPLVPYLGTGLDAVGVSATFKVGPYNQIVQECLSEGETARFRPDVLVVWPRLDELWGGLGLPLFGGPDAPSAYEEDAARVVDAGVFAAKRWGAKLVFVLPAVPDARPLGVGDAARVDGVFATATAVREAVRRRLAAEAEVLVVDAEEAVRSVGSRNCHDPRLLVLAHVPFTDAFFCEMGDRIARLVNVDRRGPRGLVVVRGEQTLWPGGASPADAVVAALQTPAGRPYRHFQEWLRELARAGTAIALVTSAAQADAQALFATSALGVDIGRFSAVRFGTDGPASAAIRAIADQLGAPLERVVYVDADADALGDAASLGVVACVPFPHDAAGWRDVVEASGALDRVLPPAAPPATPRNAITLEIAPPSSADLAPLAELLATALQFNMNGRRYTEAELAGLVGREGWTVCLVRAHGEDVTGTVGAFVARRDGDRAVLEAFAMGRKAAGLGVDEAMIAGVFEALERSGVREVVATVVATPRNEPARRFFADLGCAPGEARSVRRLSWPRRVGRKDAGAS